MASSTNTEFATVRTVPCCHPPLLKEDGEGHVAGRLLVTFGSAGGSGSSGRLRERLFVHDSWSIEEPLEVFWA